MKPVKRLKGYNLIYMPEHPNAMQDKGFEGYVYEHVHVLEQKLGRYLTSDEVVHHKDGFRDNNSLDNLLLLTKEEYKKLIDNIKSSGNDLVEITCSQCENSFKTTVSDCNVFCSKACMGEAVKRFKSFKDTNNKVNTQRELVFKDSYSYPKLFAISRCGEVYSKRTKKILKKVLSKSGYWTIPTRIGGRKGKCVLIRVGREVAKTFIPNPENKPVVNHINGIKTDDRVENLEWVTCSENTIHAYELGLVKTLKGEQAWNSKLTNLDVRYIRNNYKPGDKKFGARALGRRFSISNDVISRVANRKAWKHLK